MIPYFGGMRGDGELAGDVRAIVASCDGDYSRSACATNHQLRLIYGYANVSAISNPFGVSP
jgi:hypothetical protein